MDCASFDLGLRKKYAPTCTPDQFIADITNTYMHEQLRKR